MKIELIKWVLNYGNKIHAIKCTDKESVWDHNDEMLRLWWDEESVVKVLKLATNKRFPNVKKLYIKEIQRKYSIFQQI